MPGAVVECGVWRGGSMQAVARTLLARGVTDRDLHLFDTFDGMPAAGGGRPPARRQAGRRHARAPPRPVGARLGDRLLDDVRARMEETGYPAERIHFHRGLVQDTIPAEAPERIAILRLDTDWYDSTRHELEHLYDRLDVRRRPAHRRLRLLAGRAAGRRRVPRPTTHARMLLLPMASGRVAVKP